MKKIKKIMLWHAALLTLIACNNVTPKSAKKNKLENDVQTTLDNKATSSSKTFLTAEIDGKGFVLPNTINAIEVQGQYYLVGGENEDFAMAFQLPKNAAVGSKMTEASVTVKKPTPQLYNADLAAVTIENINDKEVSGTFTFIAKTANGKLINVNNGKFTALFLKP